MRSAVGFRSRSSEPLHGLLAGEAEGDLQSGKAYGLRQAESWEPAVPELGEFQGREEQSAFLMGLNQS
jgi:hypothetical protein